MNERASIVSLRSNCDEFLRGAIQHGKATDAGNHKLANLAYDEMRMAVDNLRRQPGWLKEFSSMLAEPDPWVRSWTAAVLLGEGDSNAMEVMEDLANMEGFLGFGASEVLRQVKSGEFRSPFPETT